MSEKCYLKEEGLHTLPAGRSRKPKEEMEQGRECISVQRRA